jgi:hypothetical protein
MSTPSVLAALRAGRDAVAAGSPGFLGALPKMDTGALLDVAELLIDALKSVCDDHATPMREQPRETRLRAYDLAIAAAGGEVIA